VGNNGTGWMKYFLKDDRVRVLAVCDVVQINSGYWSGSIRGRGPAQQMVNEFYDDNGCASYEDYRELLARDDIDAVYIGTPDHWHALTVIDSARAGKHIYGQKPLSLTIAEGRKMVEAVEKAGVVFQTGSQQRSDYNFRRAAELVRNQRIGKLHTVRCGLPGGTPDFGRTALMSNPEPVPYGFNFDMWLGPAPEAAYCPARVGVNFRWVFDYSGGQVTDWGAHHIDCAHWGMGADRTGPIAIKGARGKFSTHPIYNTATDFHFECEYSSGIKMIVSNKERLGVTFEGADGWVWANRRRHEASSVKIMESKIGPGEVKLYSSDHHTKNFVDCVFSGKPTAVPIEIGHRSVTVAHLGNIALRTGRDLRWDPETEAISDDPGASAMLSRDYRNPWSI
ncbi:MAG: Gfo/Idh/MocA family oxidoreductase, partial [bacterium]|nr:Gfo/Idh/MocA family oxidoreductase [bacterium]